MKRNGLHFTAAIAVGVFLGRSGQADTILTFDALANGQTSNAQILQSFGDNVVDASPGIAVVGFGTPDIGLTWSGPGVGGTRWDYYIDTVWSAGQLDGSSIGATHFIIFTPKPDTGVTIQSFNFHPYYNNPRRYTYDWNVSAGVSVVASGSITFDSDASKAHPIAVNYTGALGQALTLNIIRTAGNGNAQDIAVDDIRFSQFPQPTGPLVSSISPHDGDTKVRPDAPFDATIKNGLAAVVNSSIRLAFDGADVTPQITPVTGGVSVSFRRSALLASASVHQYKLTYADNAVPAKNYTNLIQFTVTPYRDLQLPDALYLETFDDVTEGGVPAGWTTLNYTPGTDPAFDLSNLNSASYSDWVVVNSDRFNGPLTVYGTDTSEDYQRVLAFNPANVVNGAVLDSLAHGNILFGDSGYRDNTNQVLHLFTRDYDLSGHTDVYVSYHSLWEQNSDSFGALEYSIDQGTTWLPVVYLIDADNVVRDAQDAIDAVATFNANDAALATYIDPMDGLTKGGSYGSFIGAAVSQDLAPYISPRVQDDPIDSKRVEFFRLPAADSQPAVRFRFAHAGTDSWYFGVDDFGIYSLPPIPVAITRQPQSLARMSANSTAIFSVEVDGTPPFTYQWRSNGVDLAGATDSRLVIAGLQLSHQATYSVRIANPGGSVTSDNATLTVFEPRITGQWDFDEHDLRATYGQALEYMADTETITSFSDVIFQNELASAQVMCFPTTEITQGYVMHHGAAPNAGGTRVNQYTLVMDLFYPLTSTFLWRAILQTNPQNPNTDDADFYVSDVNMLGISGEYHGEIFPDAWQRVAVVVDLAAPTTLRMTKYIDGAKVGAQSLGGIDSRLSLQPAALLFTTGDRSGTYTQPGCVNSIQFFDGVLNDAQIAGLGSAKANGLPLLQILNVERTLDSITIQWRPAPNVLLLKSTSLNNPFWQEIPATVGLDSYSEPATQGTTFYRLGFF